VYFARSQNKKIWEKGDGGRKKSKNENVISGGGKKTQEAVRKGLTAVGSSHNIKALGKGGEKKERGLEKRKPTEKTKGKTWARS